MRRTRINPERQWRGRTYRKGGQPRGVDVEATIKDHRDRAAREADRRDQPNGEE